MLKIGFANQFYTLWNVQNEDRFSDRGNGNFSAYTVTIFTYYQNLSKDLETAQAKASKMGATELTPDPELKGQSGSFSIDRRPKYEPEVISDDLFHLGKYYKDAIADCDDLDYLLWFHGNGSETTERAQNIVNQILEISDDHTIFKGDLMTKDQASSLRKYRKLLKKVRETNFIEVEIMSNISGDEHPSLKVDLLGDAEDWRDARRLYLSQDVEIKQMYYNGYEYYLPVIDGKAKRIKGKTVKLWVEIDERDSSLTVVGFDL